MAIQYHIYKGNASGGPIDYGTVVATTAGLTYATPALALSSTTRYAVRSFDTVSSLEEANVDATVRIVVDAGGADVTLRPNAPGQLAIRPILAGGLRVSWTYNSGGQGGAPTSFRVWATAGGSVNYAASPLATVPYVAGILFYSTDLTGLTGGTSYAVGVRATNATGDELNTTFVSAVADTTGPDAVEGLVGTATA